jgi:RecB family exonuclease
MFTAKIAAFPQVIAIKAKIATGRQCIADRALVGAVPATWTDRLAALEADLYRLEGNLYQSLKDDFHANAEY